MRWVRRSRKVWSTVRPSIRDLSGRHALRGHAQSARSRGVTCSVMILARHPVAAAAPPTGDPGSAPGRLPPVDARATA
jgi:hypothetical protein